MSPVMTRSISSGLRCTSFAVLCLFTAACFSQAVRATEPKKPAKGPGDITAIQHIVFIVKENRSFDNYFGQYPGADGATTGLLSTGQTMTLEHTPDQVVDMGHD